MIMLSNESIPRMKGVQIVNDPKMAEKLVDPMRRTILSMLANCPMTESRLARTLGLTESAIGYHLKTLEAIGFVRVVKREPEPHGIIQKFYASSAIVFIIDTNHMPQSISRYFFPIDIERMRGGLSILSRGNALVPVDDRTVEKLATQFVDFLIEASGDYGGEMVLGREELTMKLYSAAFQRMIAQGILKLAHEP
jgi:DNA-binding transcriptional ArsR family regulator